MGKVGDVTMALKLVASVFLGFGLGSWVLYPLDPA